jgi:hypothetical protein
MIWNGSNTIGLAKASCAFCKGHGLRPTRWEVDAPCRCVFRAVFRACYNRFRECATNQERTSTATLERCNGRDSRRYYSRKREEYIADFCLVSRRLLDDFEYRIFRFHFLLGADWRLCCRQMQIDRGAFFHAVYDIEQKLGQAFAELEPYPLYPLTEYFGGVIHRSGVVTFTPEPVQAGRNARKRLKVPVRIPMLEAVKQVA